MEESFPSIAVAWLLVEMYPYSIIKNKTLVE